MKYLLTLLLFTSISAYAQLDHEVYQKAKAQFEQENYQSARQYFQTLINDNPKNQYAVYSTFFHALCSYRIGDVNFATDTWQQLLAKYPNWEKSDEVYFWLTKAYIKGNKAAQAFQQSSNIKDAEIQSQLEVDFAVLLSRYNSEESLDSLYQAYPFNKQIAVKYASVLSRNFQNPRSAEIIAEINEKFGLSQDLMLIKKPSYKVAVLLPFMYESLSDTRVISRNKFVLDLYQGMQLAVQDLKGQGIDINLYPYDTKRSKEATAAILAREEMLGFDLIVGPLYPEPFQLVSEFSLRNKINMINPVSSNQQIIENNPYSYLLKPTYETMAWAAANYAIKNLKKNKNVMVFYDEDERLEAMAKLYAEILTANDFKIVRNLKVPKENNRVILETMTRTYEVYLNAAQRDSISRMPRRFVKERASERNPSETIYYEERYRIAPDSIGHIFVASNNTLIAANAVGGLEIRGDKIPLIGMGEWLNFNVLSLEQLERLGVMMIHPNNVHYESEKFYDINTTLTKEFRQMPSINQYSGYEVIWLAGKLMHEYGTYFQIGLQQGKMIQGQIFEGYKYGYARDNQIVPIVKMKDSALQVVNDIYE